MAPALVLCFVATATAGAAVVLRGRRAGIAVVVVLGAVALVVAAVAGGRVAVGDTMLGALVGMPVLLAGLVGHERRERRRVALAAAP